jgi:predicted ATPase
VPAPRARTRWSARRPIAPARLQGFAGANGVAIDTVTRQEIGGLFECRDLGLVALKGLPEPVRAWLVQGESGVVSRFEALRAGRLTPLIGRREELDLLLRRWRRAARGEGNLALMGGEPGIGKSRLIAALEERLGDEPRTRLRYFCSPYHQDSPLAPIIGQLEHAAGFARGDTDADKLAKLRALLAVTATTEEDTALVAALLSLPTEGARPALGLSPQRRKELTFAALTRQCEALTRMKPVLMLVEDVHWADPSSRELFDLIIDRLAGLPLLLVMTFRLEFQPPWVGRAGVSLMTLSRFDRRETETMTAEVATRAIPAELIERIVAQTDGVPLFVEELTRAVVETGLLDASRLGVPETLQASLLARLDQLPAAKTVAQIGSVIDRSFSHEVVAAVAQLSEPALSAGLQQLVGSGLAFQHGAPADADYTFKHALVQDAVYQSLLRARRRHLHARVAEALEELSPRTAETEPEVIAQHCTAAGLAETAISWWRRAADGAAQRSAHAEAVTHLRRALELLALSSSSADRTVLELDLQLALGVALISAKSYAAPEAGEAYARARDLCQQVGDSPHLFPALRGLWAFYRHRAESQSARGVAEQFLNLAEKLQNSEPLLEAHRVMGLTLFDVGELCAGLDHLERAIAVYDPQRHSAHAISYGQDPGVASLCQAGLLLWVLGYPDRASKQMRRGVVLAERLEHPFTLSGALFCSTQLSQLRREFAQAQAQAERAIEISAKHGFSNFESQCVILRGWARAMLGEREDGIADIRRGLAGYEALGAKVMWPAYAALMAEALAKAGEIGKGLDVLGQAKRTEELRWEPELERVEGELMLSQGAAEKEAEALFRHAFTVARRHCAKSFELRTAMSLTGLLRRQGRLDEARDLLGATYDWFSEGLDTEDLTRARRLLRELAAGGITQ